MRRILLIVGVAAVSSALTAAAIVLPASAGGDSSSDDGISAFESCMSEQGFELGSETTVRVTPDGVWVNGEEVDADAFRAAMRECGPPFRDLVPNLEDGELPDFDGVLPPELDERLEQLRDCVEATQA